ncbi:hypothetical protein CCYA_CCYA09G2550 [Cyanidiococcus yangmingshanensis]|nr:hypothetical protein CCYA_CCYA09G2550 [Cyanidiococcus yangmingshanensis]
MSRVPWTQRRFGSAASLVTLDSALKSPRGRLSTGEVVSAWLERAERETCESITTEFSRIGSTEPTEDGCSVFKESQKSASEHLDSASWVGQVLEPEHAGSEDRVASGGSCTPVLRCTDESIESLLTPVQDFRPSQQKKVIACCSAVNETLEQVEAVLGLLERYWQAEQRYGCELAPGVRQPHCWWSSAASGEVYTRSAVILGRRREAFTRIAWRARARQVEAIFRHAPSMDSAVAAVMFLDRGMAHLVRNFTDAERHRGHEPPCIRLLHVGMPLVALASLWIATKIHECEAGDVETWLLNWPAEKGLRISQSPYEGYRPPISLPLVKAVELVLLDLLGWDLVPATTLHFAMTFAAIGALHCHGLRTLTTQLCCLSLLEPAIAGRYPPSVIGLGCLLSAVRIREHAILSTDDGLIRLDADRGLDWAQETFGFLMPNGDAFISTVQELETILRDMTDPVPPANFSRSISPYWPANSKPRTSGRKRGAHSRQEYKIRRLGADTTSPHVSGQSRQPLRTNSNPLYDATDSDFGFFEHLQIGSTAGSPVVLGLADADLQDDDWHVDAYRSMLQRSIIGEFGRCRQECFDCPSVL